MNVNHSENLMETPLENSWLVSRTAL